MKVDVAAVERELDRIQRELTNTEVRASLFNLVVVSSESHASQDYPALNYMLGKRAARVIHIVRGANRESSLEVSARCFVDQEHKGVCFQEIVITTGADEAGDAPGSWVPLLVRDIPTFALWLDRMAVRVDLLADLSEQADKIVVDTGLSVGLGDDPDSVSSILRRMVVDEQISISDFAFRRLRPVQKACATAFDDPARLPLLRRISSVSVSGIGSRESAYLALWLADRLLWKRSGSGFTDGQGRVIEFTGSNRASDSTEIVFGFHDHEAVTVHLQDGCVDVDCDDSPTGGVSTGNGDGELLLEEVDAMAPDALFRAAIRTWETGKN